MTHNLSFMQKTGYVLALLLTGVALAGRAQSAPGPVILDPAQASTRFPDKTATVDRQDMTEDMHRMRLLNTSRQKSMVSDANKLLALARVLNTGVGADGSALSAAQKMRMAADIEKLARSVKEKMSYVIGTPSTASPVHPLSDAWPQ